MASREHGRAVGNGAERTVADGLFALGERVEIFHYLRWIPATVVMIRVTTRGLFYSVAGDGFGASLAVSEIRPARGRRSLEIIGIRISDEGVAYEFKRPGLKPANDTEIRQ
jgi:hypothetical protein